MGVILSLIIAGSVSIAFQLQAGVGFSVWLLILTIISVVYFMILPKRLSSKYF